MTPQPSPTNLSDELRGKLTTILTHTWYLHTELRCADKTGKKKEDVLIPGSQFQVTPSDKTLDEVLAAITAAYAEAIRSAVPEKRDTKTGEYECAHCGSKHAVYQPVHSSDNAYNAAIDTMLKNLKERGLIK